MKKQIIILAHVLQTYGFNAETGLTIVAEHGTAAIRKDLADRQTVIQAIIDRIQPPRHATEIKQPADPRPLRPTAD